MNHIFLIMLLVISAGGILIFLFGFGKRFMKMKDIHGWQRVKSAAMDELFGD